MEDKTISNIFLGIAVVVVVFLMIRGTIQARQINNLGNEFCESKGNTYSGEYVKFESGYGFMCFTLKGDFLLTEWVYYNNMCEYDFSQKIKSCDIEHYVDTADVIKDNEVN